MRIRELFESDEEHRQALNTTGFWGKQAAGCIFLAKSTKRFLISHRSNYVEQPSTWGSWGGAIDAAEDPASAVKREIKEEAGYTGKLDLIPLYVFSKDTFRYSNFLAVVPEEFTPKLDWENQGYVWCEYGDWPRPLHFGLVSLLNDAPSVEKIKMQLGQETSN